MRLSDISIRNPVFAWMLMAAMIVFGAIGFMRLGVSQMPDVDFPNVTISLSLEGASPEVMETDVLDVVEDAVMSIEGIREVTSKARQGLATVSIEFELSRNVDAAVQDVNTRLLQSQRLLPREMDPPVVTKQNPEDNPILWVALSGNVPLPQLMQYARFTAKDSLQTVSGVGEVQLSGYLDRNLRVWLRLDEMESRKLAVDDVVAALQREHIEIPAGRIETGDREMNVRAMGEAPSVEEFKKITVAYRNGAAVTINDIAVVEDGLADIRRISRANGIPAVGLGIKKQRGANAVDVAHGVKARMEEMRRQLPQGMNLTMNFDSTVFVEDSIREMNFTLLLSIALTAIVCWLFLGSFSSTFNILLSIPTSIMGSFFIIYLCGFTLNTFTLLGLSLAVGIVVDDAIMVLENIVRHREKGDSKVAAASKGAREITGAAIAATLALMAIFIPIALMKGILGKFLVQFGVTMSVAVALSLLEALTLTPMRCAQMLTTGERSTAFGRKLDGFFHWMSAMYGRILAPALKWRWVILTLSTAGFAASLLLAGRINQELIPSQDQSIFLAMIQTPAGSSIEYTDQRMRECEDFMLSRKDVKRIYTAVGGFSGGEVDSGFMFVTLQDPKDRPGHTTQADAMNAARGKFNSIPGVLRAFPIDLSSRGLTARGGNSFPIQLAVSGPDWTDLAKNTDLIKDKMKDSGLMQDINTDYTVGTPEIEIVPDRKRAADLGVNMSTLGTTVNALIGGVRAAKFTDAGHRFDVRVRLLSDERSRPEDVNRLFLRSRDGNLVRLSEVVRLERRATVQTITRRNRSRAITVSANLVPGKSQSDAMNRIRDIAGQLPAGYRIDFVGTSQTFTEGFWAFAFALGMGVVVAYMVLASQFNSFVHPVLILLAMPFSLTGAIVAMIWAGVSFNLYSMIGIVLLMGIVKKNSILLVEFTSQMRERGHPVKEAILIACPIRLRPILMTTISTLAAAVPPAMAIGPGAETRIPMAIVVIGGLTLSTLLTLFVVPCAYSLVPGRVRHAESVEKELAEAGSLEAPAH